MANNLDIQKLSEPFPAQHISTRTKGGVELSYISHAEIVRRLNEVDPDWEIHIFNSNGVPVYDVCPNSGTPTGAWFSLTICGVTKTVYGSYEPSVKADVKSKLMSGEIKWSPLMDMDAPKKILSDAITTGAMRWGVGLQLWSKTTVAKSVEDTRNERIKAISVQVKAGGEPLATEVRSYLNGRKPSELSDVEVDGLEALVKKGVNKSPIVVAFLVQYASMSDSAKAEVGERLAAMGIDSIHNVSEEAVLKLEAEAVF